VAAYDSAGVCNITVRVSEGLATHGWTLTVLNVNRPPIIESYTPVNSSLNVVEGATLTFTQASSDPDGDLLTYSWLLNGVLQATTQNWTYLPSSDDIGPHNVTLAVSDPSGQFDSQQWEVTVVGTRDFFFEFLTLFGIFVALYSLVHLIKLKPNKKK
jgi:hypothetical protein